MIAKIEKYQLHVILKLCSRMRSHDFKIKSIDCSDAELYVLNKLEKTNAPYGGWWTDDETINIFVEFDHDHDHYEVYCGDGWI